MIAFLEGKLALKEPTHVIIDVNGVGYEVKISLSTFGKIKDKEAVRLATWLHIKEDAHTLYGFAQPEEKKVFLQLISVSGIGPAIALTALSSMDPDEIRSAILAENAGTIESIKGIGKKTAQRLILELKDKIGKETVPSTPGTLSVSSHNTLREEALSALVTLGIARNAAEKAVSHVLKQEGKNVTLEELIKLALKTT